LEVSIGGVSAWVLAEHLSPDNPALADADRVLLIESERALSARPYHRQKLHLLLSAMRHFAEELRERGYEVEIVAASDFGAGVRQHVLRHDPSEVRVLDPTRKGARRDLERLERVAVVDGTLFLTSDDDFRDWADGRRRFVMEDFYRWQRERFDVLMDRDGKPVEGRWNFDAENRRPPPSDRLPPRPYRPRESQIDCEVRRDLDQLDLDTFGEDGARRFAASRSEARRALARFLEVGLPDFGPWQDAMLGGKRRMWHSGLSAPMNLGLIGPLEIAERAEVEYRAGRAPIASVEGFVRQVIGWREFVWGVYRALDWNDANALDARAPVPGALWTGSTRMACVADVMEGVRKTGYAHHIERLMVLGNLMLLLGVDPDEALEWFTLAFVDAYEWVMAPNVIGMALYADGGRMSTKPYAAGGRYVSRMSDHCARCEYEPTRRLGPDACPLSTLYWDFLDRNRDRLAENHRMSRVLAGLGRIDASERRRIRERAGRLRDDLESG
jgi:deoxyribodipyrimidine photolyase-related protein